MDFFDEAIRILKELVAVVNGVKNNEFHKLVKCISKRYVTTILCNNGIAYDLHPRPPPNAFIPISAWKGDENLCRNR